MRIAIEGTDCSGKTTLIKNLFPQLTRHHVSGKPTWEYYKNIENDNDIIFDRFVIGDIVYNRPRLLTEEQVIYMLNTLDVLILNHPQVDEYRNRVKERDELSDLNTYLNERELFYRTVINFKNDPRVTCKIYILA